MQNNNTSAKTYVNKKLQIMMTLASSVVAQPGYNILLCLLKLFKQATKNDGGRRIKIATL